MSSATILSFLTQRHVKQKEVLASDGLVYLLRGSHDARAALGRFMGLERENFFVEGQLVGEGTRPDLALLDTDSGKPIALIEVKFWAELTEGQPSKYLEILDDAGGGSLWFVAPTQRHPVLWKLLLERAPGFIDAGEVRFLATRGRTQLRLISWEELLAPLAPALAGSSRLGDLEQLRGLVRDFESAEFRPLQAEDISNLETPLLIMALSDLADAIVREAAAAKSIVTLGRLLPAHGWYSAGRYLMLSGRAGAWLGLNHAHWVRHGVSPLWLEFATRWAEWSAARRVRKVFSELFTGSAPTAFEDESGNLLFAVPVSLQVERHVAVRSAADWLIRFGQRLIDADLPPVAPSPAQMGQ